jgi:transcriptional regulator with XRE-family HTH domain
MTLSARAALKIKALMEAQGVTQEDLASRLGVSQGSVSQALSGASGPMGLDTLERYAGALGRDVSITMVPNEEVRAAASRAVFRVLVHPRSDRHVHPRAVDDVIAVNGDDYRPLDGYQDAFVMRGGYSIDIEQKTFKGRAIGPVRISNEVMIRPDMVLLWKMYDSNLIKGICLTEVRPMITDPYAIGPGEVYWRYEEFIELEPRRAG